jgi:hypothetical protein
MMIAIQLFTALLNSEPRRTVVQNGRPQALQSRSETFAFRSIMDPQHATGRSHAPRFGIRSDSGEEQRDDDLSLTGRAFFLTPREYTIPRNIPREPGTSPRSPGFVQPVKNYGNMNLEAWCAAVLHINSVPGRCIQHP